MIKKNYTHLFSFNGQENSSIEHNAAISEIFDAPFSEESEHG